MHARSLPNAAPGCSRTAGAAAVPLSPSPGRVRRGQAEGRERGRVGDVAYQRDGRDGGYLTSKERTASKRVTGTGGAVDRSRLGYARCLARDGSTPRPPPRG